MDTQGIVQHLLHELEGANSDFINTADRETWAEALRSVDERLAVVGLRLLNRPWEQPEQASAVMAATGF